ncbi:MAG TPA: M91 family zinc metallopeptidase [Stellaceae bacterium]|nr:M91 family zinc metallopeptidase [Stellaceae bacterium]
MKRLWSHDYPGINVELDPVFFQKACRDLDKIASKPLGKDLLTLISKRTQGTGTGVGKTVLIRHGLGSMAESAEGTGATAQGLGILREGKALPGTSIQLPGIGASSIAEYNPDADLEYARMCGLPTPAFIALAHELTHCWHHLSGTYRTSPGGTAFQRWQAGYMQEEAFTVGLGPYAGTRLCENAYREEWNIKKRTYYSDPGDCDNLPKLSDQKF